jgi:hypothetical protein
LRRSPALDPHFIAQRRGPEKLGAVLKSFSRSRERMAETRR